MKISMQVAYVQFATHKILFLYFNDKNIIYFHTVIKHFKISFSKFQR